MSALENYEWPSGRLHPPYFKLQEKPQQYRARAAAIKEPKLPAVPERKTQNREKKQRTEEKKDREKAEESKLKEPPVDDYDYYMTATPEPGC